jgi:glycosyltransferase involved in cell wall biosynthesis
VTVAVPTFNRAATIRSCLESVLAQSFGDFVLAVSDNASTDATAAICREYAQRDPRVRVIVRESNVGATANFNGLLAAADTDYFMWLADDDAMSPNFLEEAVRFLDDHPGHVAVNGRTVWHHPDSGAEIYSTLPRSLEAPDPVDRIVQFIESLYDCTEVFALYRRELIADLGFPHLISHDWIFLADVIYRGKTKILPHIGLRRVDHWVNPARHRNSVRNMGLPESQGEEPYYCAILYHFMHMAVFSPLYDHLTDRRRLEMAVRVFRAYRAKPDYRVPDAIDIGADLARFFPELDAAGLVAGLRRRIAGMDNDGSAGTSDLLLYLARDMGVAALPYGFADDVSITLGEGGEDDGSAMLKGALAVHPCRFARGLRGSHYTADILDALASLAFKEPPAFADEGEAERHAAFLQNTMADLAGLWAPGDRRYAERYAERGMDSIRTILRDLDTARLRSADVDLRPLMGHRAAVAEQFLLSMGHPIGAPDKPADKPGPLHVAVVLRRLSPDRMHHPGVMLAEGLRRHGVRVSLVAFGAQSDQAVIETLRARLADGEVVLLGGSLKQDIARIRDLSFDAAIIADDVTARYDDYLFFALQRLARHQVALATSPVTTGMREVDYYLSGAGLVAEDGLGHSERILSIPGFPLVFARDRFPVEPAAVPGGDVRFVTGAPAQAVSPASRLAWLGLLAVVPESRLALAPLLLPGAMPRPVPGAIECLPRDAAKAGIEAARIDVAGEALAKEAFRARLAGGAVYLDPMPGWRAEPMLHALSLGVPVVAMRGRQARARLGAALLESLGLGDWVAESAADYMAKARALAVDGGRRAEASARAVAAIEDGAAVFDGGRFGREVAEALTALDEGTAAA